MGPGIAQCRKQVGTLSNVLTVHVFSCCGGSGMSLLTPVLQGLQPEQTKLALVMRFCVQLLL